VAPLAERFVRVRADTRGFAAELRKGTTGPAVAQAGAQAGAEWSAAFTRVVKARLSQLDLKVKVKAVVDMSAAGRAAKQDSAYMKGSDLPPNYLPRSHGQPRPKSRSSTPDAPSDSQAPLKLPVELDPLVKSFQGEVRKQIAALSKDVHARVPVTPETAALRGDIADKLRVVERQLSVKVPAGPDARKFEVDLRALVREVEHQVKVSLPVELDGAVAAGKKAAVEAKAGARGTKVPIELDPLTAQFQANVRRELAGLRRLSAQIPVNPNTDGLRRDISLQIAAIERGLKIKVPVGADGNSVVSGLTGQLGGLKGALGGALGLAPQALQVLSGGFDAISGSATKAAGSAGQLGSSLSGLAGPVGTALTVGLVALAISAIPAAVGAAIGAVYALGGALASLPALGVGLGAVVGTLSLGFKGLSDHFKKTASGGGGAAKSMSAVRNATRAVTQAQRELLKATKDIDRARADEIERIDDLGRSLRGARLDEEDAAAGVAEARQRLAEARASGDVNAIGEADRAYRRSLLTLDEARDKTGDLSAEKAKADRDGVEGSDQVQQALERQRDATERLTAAQEALTDAQKSAGGGGGMAQQLTKLAPAAQEVVNKLKQLKPVFEEIRLAVQQELFKGVAGELQKLSDAWKKPLKDTLTSYASTINGLFLNLGKSVRDADFIKNITSAAETFRTNFDKIGKAVTGPLVGAFGQLAAAAKPFLDAVGDKVTKLVTDFSAWIDKAEKSGALNQFFKDAAFYFNQLWDVGKNVFAIIGEIFGIITGTETDGGAKSMFEGLNAQLVAFRDWLKDPENQKKLKEFFENVGKLVEKGYQLTTWITEHALPALAKLIGWVGAAKQKFDEWGAGVSRAKETIIGAFSTIGPAFGLVVALLGGQTTSMVNNLNGVRGRLNFGGMFDGLYNSARSALNSVVDLFNRLSLSLNFSIGGSRIGTSISGLGRKLAAGGIARATPGGIQATIAEGGKDEVVSPVEQMQDYIRTAVAEANANSPASHSGNIIIPIYMYPGAAEYDRYVITAAERNKAQLAKIVNGGNKKLAYGG
jgi:hypothetical protein